MRKQYLFGIMLQKKIKVIDIQQDYMKLNNLPYQNKVPKVPKEVKVNPLNRNKKILASSLQLKIQKFIRSINSISLIQSSCNIFFLFILELKLFMVHHLRNDGLAGKFFF